MTVIKKTRLQFFAVTAAVILTIVTVFCVSILVPTYTRNAAETRDTLEKMIEDFGRDLPGGPAFPGADRFRGMRGFTMGLNADFEITGSRYNESVFTFEEIKTYVKAVRAAKKTRGGTDNLEFLIRDTAKGKVLACLDVSLENAMLNELLITVLLAGGGGILVLLVLVWFLSYRIVKPAAEAFQKQKRFISEAGHELKTPLTVISASMELLAKSEDPSEREKWHKNIKEQTEKMSAMTAELLTLSKLEETEKAVKIEFDLSRTVLTEVLAFESVAFENGKILHVETDENIFCKGDPQAVRQAVGILCDNAIKHSDPGGTVDVFLKGRPTGVCLRVSNTGCLLNKEDLPLLFERFYRGSDSRAETKGAGLGLAILKTLAERSGWKLDTSVEQEKITFSILF